MLPPAGIRPIESGGIVLQLRAVRHFAQLIEVGETLNLLPDGDQLVDIAEATRHALRFAVAVAHGLSLVPEPAVAAVLDQQAKLDIVRRCQRQMLFQARHGGGLVIRVKPVLEGVEGARHFVIGQSEERLEFWRVVDRFVDQVPVPNAVRRTSNGALKPFLAVPEGPCLRLEGLHRIGNGFDLVAHVRSLDRLLACGRHRLERENAGLQRPELAVQEQDQHQRQDKNHHRDRDVDRRVQPRPRLSESVTSWATAT